MRCEVGICIQTGETVWLNDPCPCGEWSDLHTATQALMCELEDEEKALADGGYNDHGIFFETPTGHNNYDQVMNAKARARHECVNRRFKEWAMLQQRFRSHIPLHGIAFGAVANLVHMQMKGEGLWQVQDDNTADGPFGKIFYKDRWEHCHDTLVDRHRDDYADY